MLSAPTIVTFAQQRDEVTVIVNGERKFTADFKTSLEACRAMDLQLRSVAAQTMNPALAPISETGLKRSTGEIAFRQEFGKLLCIAGGKVVFEANTAPTEDGGPSIARRIWSAWKSATQQAELYSRNAKGEIVAHAVARDAAILHRAGAPMGITDHPAIKAEARGLARDDRDLRRFMKDRRRAVTGKASDEVLGAPVIGHDNRTPFQHASNLLVGLGRDARRALLSQLSAP
jgi:hypothetical protein